MHRPASAGELATGSCLADLCVYVCACVYMCACGRDPGVLYTSGPLRARARSLRDLAQHRIASRSRSRAKGNGYAHLRFVFISCSCMIAASSNEKKMTVKILRPDSFPFFWNCCFFDALLRFFINDVRSILQVSSYFSGGGRRGQIDRRIHGTPSKCASFHIWDDPRASTLARYLRSVCVAVPCVGRDVARTARWHRIRGHLVVLRNGRVRDDGVCVRIILKPAVDPARIQIRDTKRVVLQR